MEYSCSRVVFSLYEALHVVYLIWIFKLSDTKLCDNQKICNFSIREVFSWVRSDMVEHQIAKMKLLMRDDPRNSRFIKINYTCKYSTNTISNKDLVEHQIAKMKLLMKDHPSNSRFIKINYTCKYTKNTTYHKHEIHYKRQRRKLL